MEWQIPDYAYRFFFPVIFSTVIAIFAYTRRKQTLAAGILFVLMLLAVLWSIFYIMELSAISEQAQYFANDLSYIPIVTVPAVLLIFILLTTGKIDLLNRRRIIILFIIPAITLLLVWTSKHHHLFYKSISFVPETARNVMTIERGLFYWIFIAYAYFCLLACTIIAFNRILKTTGVYKNQAVIMSLGTIIPWIGSVSDILFGTIKHIHFMQVSFVLAGIVFMVGINKFKIISISPIARDKIVDRMTDFMLVINEQNLVIDINHAFLTFLGKNQDDILGCNPESFFPSWESLTASIEEDTSGTIEVKTSASGAISFLDVSRIPLYTGRRNEQIGTLFMMNDISDQVLNEKKLKNQLATITALEKELKEQAIRDSLTGLYNRRYLDEISHQMFSRAQRDNEKLAIMFLDIDNFKALNDEFGHKTGDDVLKQLSRILLENVRSSDVVCRFGGEEFIVLFPNTSRENAIEHGEMLRKLFESDQIPAADTLVKLTFSAGIAVFPDDGDDKQILIDAADRTMYEAKRAGKNRIAAFLK